MNILGFDVGGTYIKFGIVDENGNILFKDKAETPTENCGESIPNLMAEKANELKKNHKIDKIGISTAGQVDSQNGVVVFAANLKGFSGCRIKEIVESKTSIQTIVENDANAAALGEMWQGAGKGSKHIICLTLGTGVGGAAIINGRVYKGFHGYAGEFSRMVVVGKMIDPSEKGKFILDKTASTSSLVERYRRITGEKISGLELMNRVKQSEKDAVAAYDDFLESLLFGIDTIINFFDPETIIIGGGISAQGGYFFDKVRTLFKERTYPGYEDVQIKKAALENDAGLLGAAYICIKSDYYL